MSLRLSYSKYYSSKPDHELWTEFKEGDRDAFTHIYYQHAKALLDYALKITSDKDLIEDCMQEMFLDLWNRRSRLNDVQVIKSYLFTTLRRRVLKSAKKQNVHKNGAQLLIDPEFELPLENSMVIREEEIRKKESINEVLNKLSPQQREIVYLKFFSDFSFDEIADILQTHKKAVYNSLSKSMIKFRKALNSVNTFLFL